MPLGDILSREKDVLKPKYCHEILVRGPDFQACRERVLDFFRNYQLVRYSYITVPESEALSAENSFFHDRLHKAITKNRQILRELVRELQGEGIHTLTDIEEMPQGYKTKMLHVITHLLDGFFGIDSYFYNLEEDSHGITEKLQEKVKESPSDYWLLSIEARI
jgi:hypothetical protein